MNLNRQTGLKKLRVYNVTTVLNFVMLHVMEEMCHDMSYGRNVSRHVIRMSHEFLISSFIHSTLPDQDNR